MGFEGKLRTEEADSGYWRLLEALRYKSNSGRTYCVNAIPDFYSDLASIPFFLRIIFIVNGRHRRPAVLHDWFYYKQGRLQGCCINRKEADDLFYEAMRSLKIPKWKCQIFYLGVRIGGWWHWYRVGERIKEAVCS